MELLFLSEKSGQMGLEWVWKRFSKMGFGGVFVGGAKFESGLLRIRFRFSRFC